MKYDPNARDYTGTLVMVVVLAILILVSIREIVLR
jgi:hypothetical protein